MAKAKQENQEETVKIQTFEIQKESVVKAFRVLNVMQQMLDGVTVSGETNLKAVSESLTGIRMVYEFLIEDYARAYPEEVSSSQQ